MSLVDPFAGLTAVPSTGTGASAPVAGGAVGTFNPASTKKVIYIDNTELFWRHMHRLTQLVAKTDAPVLVAIDTETTANRRIIKLYEDAQAALLAVKARFDALPSGDPELPDMRAKLADARAQVNGLAFEVKKAGLNVGNGQVRLVQVYRGGEVVLVFDRWKITPDDWRTLCADFLNHANVHWVMHNAYFDVRMLHQHGAHPANPVNCTLLQAHALEPLTTIRKTLAGRCQAVLGYTISKELQNSDWSREDLDYDQVAYAAGDVVATFDLFHAQRKLLLDRQTKATADTPDRPCDIYRLMADTIPAVTEIHTSGLGFNVEAHKALTEKLEQEDGGGRAAALTAMRDALPNVPLDNPGSTQQVSKWVQEAIRHPDTKGQPNWPRTATGQLAVGREDLLLNLSQLGERFQEPLRLLAAWYKAKKMNSTLGGSFARWVNTSTNRIHANFRIGTETGRFSVTEPPLQTINRGSEFRALFQARAGYKLVDVDYATIELRVAAVVSGDPVMMQAIDEGADIHSMTAALAFKSRPEVIAHLQATLAKHPELKGQPRVKWAQNKFFCAFFKDKDQPGVPFRNAAKTTVFATLYGAGPNNIAGQLQAMGIDVDADGARDIQRAIFEIFEVLGQWISRTRLEAMGARDYDEPGHGHVWTPGGRWYKPDNPNQLYTKSVNTPIQGGAAEIMLRALSFFPKAWNGLDARLVHVVHDELIAEVREDQAQEAGRIMERCMMQAALDRFPNISTTKLAEAAFGQTWKDAK